MATEKIILGIDPGTTIMGFGLIKVIGKKMEFLQLNELQLKKYDDHYLKLKLIFERTVELIDTHHPDEIAIEAPFFGKNVQSMLKLGRAQGVAMAAGLSREVPITEYSPKKIKMAITGNGNATKEQVAKDLPEKTETIIYCEMETAQRRLYENLKRKIKEDIESVCSNLQREAAMSPVSTIPLTDRVNGLLSQKKVGSALSLASKELDLPLLLQIMTDINFDITVASQLNQPVLLAMMSCMLSNTNFPSYASELTPYILDVVIALDPADACVRNSCAESLLDVLEMQVKRMMEEGSGGKELQAQLGRVYQVVNKYRIGMRKK